MTDFSLRIKWLSRVAEAQDKLKTESESVQFIMERMTASSTALSGMPVSHSLHDKMADGIEKLEAARYRQNRAKFALKQVEREVYRCIMESPIRDEEKRLLVLMYIHGAKNKEISSILGKTPAGITYLHRRAVSGLAMPPGWHEQL